MINYSCDNYARCDHHWRVGSCDGCGHADHHGDNDLYTSLEIRRMLDRLDSAKAKTITVITNTPTIKKVHFNNPVTVVIWSDNTKTIVRCQEGDVFDPEKGLAMAISKKYFGNKGNYCEVFKKWVPKKNNTKLVEAIMNLGKAAVKADLAFDAVQKSMKNNKGKKNKEKK